MIRRSTFLSVFFTCIISCMSQETYDSPAYSTLNNSIRLNNRALENYDSSNSNLWLISRGDPVPANLGRQILSGDSASTRRNSGVESNNYGLRISSRSSNENTRDLPISVQSPNTYISQAPLNYDRIVTSEHRRQYLDNQVRAPETVLVELPLDITEGLWVRPEPQNLPQQPPLSGRQYIDGDSVNIKFDDNLGHERQDGIPLSFVPNRELTSRLPNSEFLSQGQLDDAQQQYYDLPYPIISSVLQGINISTDTLNRPYLHSQGISLINDNQNNVALQQNSTTRSYDNTVPATSERATNIHEYGVLTSEDIELLERLGILSALIIEPLHQDNKSSTTTDNSQREYESEPVLIDNGGQSYLTNTERQDISNLRDVVLIDIPNFTTSGYHTTLSENSGSGDQNSPALSQSKTEPENSKLNENSEFSNYTNLTDRQIFEILQLLSSNTGDFFNLSTLPDLKETAVPEQNLSNKNLTEQPLNITISSNATKESFQLLPSSNSTNSSIASTKSIETQTTTVEQTVVAPPSVSNGRIQPRLLNKLTKNDNEIIEELLKKVPMSESKLGILERLEKLQNQPKSYNFGYNQNDGNGTLQHRNEKADSSGVVKGTYGYKDAFGVYRNVSYIADSNGFHAVVKTNEPGTISHNTADVVYMSKTPPMAALLQMMAYRRSTEIANAIKAP